MRLSRVQKLLMASLFVLLVMGLSSMKAAAFVVLIPNPTATQIPAAEKAYLNNCDTVNPIQSPALTSWVSEAGKPTTTSIQVTGGQVNVLLQLNFSGAVCSVRSAVDVTGTRVASSAVTSTPSTTGATVTGIDNQVLRLPTFNPVDELGEYQNTSQTFTLNAPPKTGFQGTVTYFITINHQPENHFVRGWNPPNVCVLPSNPPYIQTPTLSYTPCNTSPATFAVQVVAGPGSGGCPGGPGCGGGGGPTAPCPGDPGLSANDTKNASLSPQNVPASGTPPSGNAGNSVTYTSYVPTGQYSINSVTDSAGAESWSPSGMSAGPFAVSYNNFASSYSYDPDPGPTINYSTYYDQYKNVSTAQFAPKGCYAPYSMVFNPAVGFDTCNGPLTSPFTGYSWTQTLVASNQAAPAATTTGPSMAECYDRAFEVAAVTATAPQYLPSLEDPTSVSNSGGSITVNFTYPGPAPSKGLLNPMRVTLNYTTVYSVEGPDGGTLLSCSGSSGPFTVTGGNSPGPETASTNAFSCPATIPPLSAGDQVCVNYTVTPTGTLMDSNGNVTTSNGVSLSSTVACSAPLANEPYVGFFGNDVLAGGGFLPSPTATACTETAANGTISAFVKGSGTLLSGSGSQFGALASGVIAGNGSAGPGFNSADLRSSVPDPEDGLSFANNPSSVVGNSGTTNCVPDYYDAMPANAITSPLPNPPASGVYSYGSDSSKANLTLDLAAVPPGAKLAIYVDGNVYIKNNIAFGGSNSWASVADIPSFFLIVKGNINIASNVNQLDGVYIAQADTAVPGSGTISTCANSNGSYTADVMYTNCGNQLTINGTFIANSVQLDRTYASLRNSLFGESPRGGAANCSLGDTGSSTRPAGATNYDCAAEIFNFSPEVYLTQPEIPPSGGPALGKYDYVTSLSPIL